MSNLFDDADIVYKYTRKQALEDGVLADLTDLAKEAGIRLPLAVTQGVYGVLADTSSPGQDFKGRAWDMLMIFRLHARSAESDEIHFAPLFTTAGSKQAGPVSMWAKCGPGDDGEAVITIMLQGED